MSLTSRIERFYDELWRYAQERFGGNASLAAVALDIGNNRLTDASPGARAQGRRPPKPHASNLEKCIARGDEGLARAAQELLNAYQRKIEPYFIVRDLPPDFAQLLEERSSAKGMSFAEFRRLAPPQGLGPSPPRDLPNLIKRYTHAAMQLDAGAFNQNALAVGLHESADVGALEAYAIMDLIAGFQDLKYFRLLAAALRRRQKGTLTDRIPVHPFGVLELSGIMREPALPSESEETKTLRMMTKELIGRPTSFIFYEHNDRRPREDATEILSLLEPLMAHPMGLYRFLNRELDYQKCELPEPDLVRAGSLVAAVRLALSLIAATTTLLGLSAGSLWLEAVAAKVCELCHDSYAELGAQMRGALDRMREEQAELDRTALEREAALTISALLREEGAWFIFNTRFAFLSKCGSLTQSVVGNSEHHRFVEQRHSCKLPARFVPGKDTLWVFHGGMGLWQPGGEVPEGSSRH